MTSISARVIRFIVLITLASVGCQRAREVPQTPVHPEAHLPADNLRLLTGRAGIIFKGVVSEIKYETDTKNNLPYTYITFRQVETFKDITGKFKKENNEEIVIRNFGGLREDGKVFEMSHLPEFLLGAVYLVFYTAGEWDATPVVGGDKGAFRILKSRTLGYDFLLDQADQVIIGIDRDSIRTAPVGEEGGSAIEGPRKEADDRQSKDAAQFKLNERSLYSEENVTKLFESEDTLATTENEREDTTRQPRDSARIRQLMALPSKPMSFKEFTDIILETDRKYQKDFVDAYSNVDFEGKFIQKEKTPLAPKRKE
jgi:hypothetical protein